MLALKDIRMSKGVTTVELAKMSGISRATIHKLEHGVDDVNTKTLKALAAALGVKVTDFFMD